MLRNRIIPCLLIENQRLVKTQNFKNAAYVGDPINAVKVFNDKEVDELVILDISASRARRTPDFDFVEQLASEAFMPVAYGGGISTMSEARQLFRLGVEKVIIKTSAISNISFLSELSLEFGSSSVVASLDLKRDRKGRIVSVDEKLKTLRTRSWPGILRIFDECGVGEIFLQNVDRDGTMLGPDLDIIYEIGEQSVPITVAGGVSCLKDIKDMIGAGADAVGVGAFFTFYGPHRAVLLSYPSYEVLVNLLED